jgi:outer membrane scaffolding protein for murein synthesis (MipA/OmpV family)
MIKNDDLIIPYAMSDHASTYATVNLRELLNELKNSKQA